MVRRASSLISSLAPLVLATLMACHGDDNGGDGPQPPTKPAWPDSVEIFISGHVAQRTAHGPNFAVLWKDGEPTRLSRGIEDGKPWQGAAFGNCVFVDGDDIYVAGQSDGTHNIFAMLPTLWTNRPETDHPSGFNEIALDMEDFDASAQSIAVAGGKVYVAGELSWPTIFSTAALWVDGERTVLEGGERSIGASSVSVSPGGDVYVGGTVLSDLRSATLWKNGQATILGKPPDDYVRPSVDGHLAGAPRPVIGNPGWGGIKRLPVFLSGEDVYVAGWDHDPPGSNGKPSQVAYGGVVPTVWKNGEKRYLGHEHEYDPSIPGAESSEYGRPTSVFVDGDDVYVTGMLRKRDFQNSSYHLSYAMLWKNDEEIFLTDYSSGEPYFFSLDDLAQVGACAYDVKVLNGDVYVVGSQYSKDGTFHAVMWVNGEEHRLPEMGCSYSRAYSIVVREKPSTGIGAKEPLEKTAGK